MFRISLLILLGSIATTLTAQVAFAELPADAARPADAPAPVAYRHLPELPAATGGLATFLAGELDYPDVAHENAIEGTVVLEVLVSADGRATYLRTVKPLFGPLDAAAVAAVARLPRFAPAVRDGRPVDQRMMIPIRFSLR